MGIAERFKSQLETKNIFEKDIIEQKLEEKEIKFISKPTANVPEAGDIQTQNSGVSCICDNPDRLQPDNVPTEPICAGDVVRTDVSENNLEDMETELVDKIRKTPYWTEFSVERQTRMIENWFNAKTKRVKYSQMNYTSGEKENFVRTVLVLANNR